MDSSLRKNRLLTFLLHAVVYWGPPIGWMVVIFMLSTRQRLTVSPVYVYNFLFFKTLHMMEYGFLFALHIRALVNTWKDAGKHMTWTAIFLTMAYAVSDEWHQTFVATREGTGRDVIIDGIGVVIVWYFLFIWLPQAPKKLRNWVKNLGLSY